ncbi:MAG TPA: DNA polymerase I, partial [Methanothrix sp.]
QMELFEVLAGARSRKELAMVEPKAREVCAKYTLELENADIDIRGLAIHRRVGKLNYSHRCAEASAVRAHAEQGLNPVPGMKIGYVVKDAGRWKVDTVESASKFDAAYYKKLLEKAWYEVAFVFKPSGK